MTGIIWALILAAVLGGATNYFGEQFIPEAGYCYFIPTGDNPALGNCINRLELTTGLGAFIGWSLGLVAGGRR